MQMLKKKKKKQKTNRTLKLTITKNEMSKEFLQKLN